jgi:sulfatase modifying factor 1
MAQRVLGSRLSRRAAWSLAGAGVLPVAFSCELLVPINDLHPYVPCTLSIRRGQSCDRDASSCGNDSCCASTLVEGGSFYRSAYATNSGAVDDASAPATVGSFFLDKYEVTVGRFRSFLASGCFTPQADAGAHPLIPGSGWDPSLTSLVSISGQTLANEMTMQCGQVTGAGGQSTLVGNDDRLPVNCVRWYEAFAFCIWDGGRLPTEAEWNYAAAGGSLQRVYPWSTPPFNPSVDSLHAWFEAGAPTIVGSLDAGAGLWGQLDMAGNLTEWVLDSFAPYATSCADCASVVADSGDRVFRGGSYNDLGSSLKTGLRGAGVPGVRGEAHGFRCAYDP